MSVVFVPPIINGWAFRRRSIRQTITVSWGSSPLRAIRMSSSRPPINGWRTWRTFQAGKYGAISQKLLNEVATAKVCLLNRAKKAAYDEELREKLAAKAAVMEAPAGFDVEGLLGEPVGGGAENLHPGNLSGKPEKVQPSLLPGNGFRTGSKAARKAPPNRCGLLPAPCNRRSGIDRRGGHALCGR